MATTISTPQSVSSFLRSYAPDKFEWESPSYCPRSSFLWSKPLTALPPTSHSKFVTNSDTTECAFHSSSDSDSLSDISVSLSDVRSGYFAALPPMNRTRTTTNSAGRRATPDSSSSSLSDMSISFPTASCSSYTLEDFESFAANVPTQTSYEPLLNATPSDDMVSSLLRGMTPGMRCLDGVDDDDLDGAAVDRILEWTTSLFATVASSVLDYSIQPGVDDVPTIKCYTSASQLVSEGETTSLLSATVDTITDSWLAPSSLVIKLNPVHPTGRSRSIHANPLSIVMPGFIEYEAINPEQPTTAKPVCMWGRRLERIPKVRLAGQKEAVYCFDARKQRQKQKASHVPPVRHAHAPGSCNPEQPTQIFYRARPLYTPFVRQDLPATSVDAVKIAQGQVLLQNVSPVRFHSTPSPSFVGVSNSHQRLPLAPRTNGLAQNRQTENVPPSLFMRKIPGPGFL